MCDKLDELKREYWKKKDWSGQQTAIENILEHIKSCQECKKNRQKGKVIIMKGSKNNGL